MILYSCIICECGFFAGSCLNSGVVRNLKGVVQIELGLDEGDGKIICVVIFNWDDPEN